MGRSSTSFASLQGHVQPGEFQEVGPVRLIGVTARMLTESDVAGGDQRFDRWKLRCAERFLPQQLIDGAGAGSGEKGAFRVYPTIAAGFHVVAAVSRAEKHRARRTHGDQLMG